VYAQYTHREKRDRDLRKGSATGKLLREEVGNAKKYHIKKLALLAKSPSSRQQRQGQEG